MAERTGQIIEMGDWVMNEVARNCLYWETLGLSAFRVCINISPLQFNQGNLTQSIADFLGRSGLSPHRLELELTESAIMTDAETNIAKLNELKALGIELAVDDFGTGYSSLSYLKRFPIDTLKIDQSFVADLNSPNGQAIVDAILALSKTMNLRSIAEGIEEADQLRYLVNQRCDLLQGLYSEDVPGILRQNFAGKIKEVMRG